MPVHVLFDVKWRYSLLILAKLMEYDCEIWNLRTKKHQFLQSVNNEQDFLHVKQIRHVVKYK